MLPPGALEVEPGQNFDEVVEELHDTVQDAYWQRLAAGLRDAETLERFGGGRPAAGGGGRSSGDSSDSGSGEFLP